MAYVIHTQVQQGVRIEVDDPYTTSYPGSRATLRVAWGNARSIEVQLDGNEVMVLAMALMGYMVPR